MSDYFEEMWSGPGHLRFFVQPALAILLGVRDGLADARRGKTPYVLGLLTERGERGPRIREALVRLCIPLGLGVGLSMLFQLVIRGRVLLLAACAYGVLFIGLPYAVARAAANRLRRVIGRQPA